MHARHVVPFLLLFAWQSAAGPDARERPGAIRLFGGLGVSTADYRYWGWEGATCDCPTCGQAAIEQAQDQASSFGAGADVWVSPTTRVTAVAGTSGSDNEGGHPAFAAGLVAWEGASLGAGAGWASGAERAVPGGPAAYLRLGPLDGPQLRADLRAPTVSPGVGGWARVGVANGSGRHGEPVFFVGVGAVEVAADTIYDAQVMRPRMVARPAFVVDASVGIRRNWDLFGRMHFGRNARALAIGAALRLDR